MGKRKVEERIIIDYDRPFAKLVVRGGQMIDMYRKTGRMEKNLQEYIYVCSFSNKKAR